MDYTKGGCGKANGHSFDNLPVNRWQIKKRIIKDLLFGNGKQATGGGGGNEHPLNRWQVKKRLLKQLFSSTTSV
ncbi:hypothetical protein Hanom_Chr08g00735491 [Helianthus anomalus]